MKNMYKILLLSICLLVAGFSSTYAVGKEDAKSPPGISMNVDNHDMIAVQTVTNYELRQISNHVLLNAIENDSYKEVHASWCKAYTSINLNTKTRTIFSTKQYAELGYSMAFSCSCYINEKIS